MRLGAQPFLRKWILFAWEWKMISISKDEHLLSFWNRGPGELGNGLLVRTLHRYFGGHGSNLRKPEFFKLSFRTYISCVFNCDDPLCIYFFIPQFNYMNSYIHHLFFTAVFSQASNTPLPTPTLLTRYAGLSFYVLSALCLLSRLKSEK